VPITVRAENIGAAAVDLYLRGRTVAFDVTVERSGGEVVWRRLDGEIVEAVLQLRTLAPGGSLTLRAQWNQRMANETPAPPGDYRLRGVLLTDDPAGLTTALVPMRVISAEA